MRASVALGSNLGAPDRHVRQALATLGRIDDIRMIAASSLYRTDPVGPPGQPDYCNAVADLDTGLAPLALLDALQAIEVAHGRDPAWARTPGAWGPRPLDLDILLLDNAIVDHPRLRVPHPHLHRRAFVLVPLAELDPVRIVPGLGRVDDLLADVDTAGVRPWLSI